jgi:hypothetical protein
MTDSDDDTHELAEKIAASVGDPLNDEQSSRRGFLARSALAGGTLLALGGGAGAALGQEAQDDDETEMAEAMTANFDDVDGTDVDVLNYALTLEHLEDAFYQEALDMFSEDDFVEADRLQSYNEEFRREVYGYVESAGEHEATHVEVLTQAVELLDGDPEQQATYEFGLGGVGDFLDLGQTLENTGVAAYAGAAPFVESPDLLGVALSIHSVEARHAALLNELNDESPFPNAFDAASSQDEVLAAAGQFIVAEDDGGDDYGGDDGGGMGEETATDTPNGTDAPAGNETQTESG